MEKICIEDLFSTVISKLQYFETRPWSAIEGKGSHFVNVEELHNEAKIRLQKKRIVSSQLFSLRITGRKRVWGHREGVFFYVLWWDPNHEVCPSNMNHT